MTKRLSEEMKKQWKESILNQCQSKLPIATWCQQNGVTVHTFYYWRKKLFPEPIRSRSAFIEINEAKTGPTSGIVLEYNSFKIYFHKHFSSSVLKTCLEALKSC